MSQHDRLLVHGAAVGNDHGAVLIVGKSGSGKSTTALACLSSGLLYLGDDYTIIETLPSPVVHSLYATAKVDVNQVNAFPHLLPKIHNNGTLAGEKALMFLSPDYNKQMIPDLPVRAILVPRVTGGPRTQLKKTSAAAALTALAPSTIFQLPRAGESNFKIVARFVSKVPCYTLECGKNLAQIPEMVLGALLSDGL
jgi:serine kinase of HPr protein (carbohydrate metabolism regulator)